MLVGHDMTGSLDASGHPGIPDQEPRRLEVGHQATEKPYNYSVSMCLLWLPFKLVFEAQVRWLSENKPESKSPGPSKAVRTPTPRSVPN